MKEKNSKLQFENRHTLKLISIVYGATILFLLLLYVMATSKNQVFGYVVSALYILLGLAMIFKAKYIGSAIFEANQRLAEVVWKRLLRMNEENIQKRRLKMESGLLGLKYHIGIIFVIGFGLIAISIWAIFMLAQGKMY